MKLAVIGIDGADPEYLERAISQGKMPTFQKLREKGCYGKLKSTFPPLSVPAWQCIYTGKNPGKLGIYSFVELKKDSYEYELVNWKVSDTIWQILSKKGKKVAVINNYFTYPPEKVNGIMISAMDNISENCYYPEKLEKEVEKNLGKLDFGIIPSYYAIPKEQLFKLTDIMLKSNVQLVNYIVKNHKIDFLFTTLDIDRLHHLVSDEKEIIQWYSKIDLLLKEILDSLGETNVILLSDHGGGKMKAEFYTNEFLKKENFLSINKKYKSKFSSFLIKIGFSMENLLKIIQFTKIDRILVKLLPDKLWDIAKEKVPRKDSPFGDVKINWFKTKAFAPFPSIGAIQINLAGREPQGIVEPSNYEKTRDEIIERFKKFCDERKIKLDIYRREEIYKGKYVEKAPDLLFMLDDWQYFPKISFSDNLFKKPRDPGHHRVYGFFLASGPEIKNQKEELKNAEITDITPTILSFFKIKKENDMDGKVLAIKK